LPCFVFAMPNAPRSRTPSASAGRGAFGGGVSRFGGVNSLYANLPRESTPPARSRTPSKVQPSPTPISSSSKARSQPPRAAGKLKERRAPPHKLTPSAAALPTGSADAEGAAALAEAEARAAAATLHMMVVFKLLALCGFLFWRAHLLPTFLGVLFLNVPMIAFDELAIMVFYVYRLGPRHVAFSLQHFWQHLMLPYVRTPLTNACNTAEARLRAAGIVALADAALAVSKAVAEPKKKAD